MQTKQNSFNLRSFPILTRQKMAAFQHPQKSIASQYVAHQIAEKIREKQRLNQNCVLGLATGSSPILVYKELIRLHHEEGLSFYNVITFNLDEYCDLDKGDKNSYYYFMNHHLFNHIDIPKENIHIPAGRLKEEELDPFCQDYESLIQKYGGLDIQVLGIGRTGHIGFNEPGSGFDSVTRRVILDELTISDAAKDFGGADNVPKQAITMGVRTILSAKKIFLMAWGAKKADILEESFCRPFSHDVPASFLQAHQNVELVLDNDAAFKMQQLSEKIG